VRAGQRFNDLAQFRLHAIEDLDIRPRLIEAPLFFPGLRTPLRARFDAFGLNELRELKCPPFPAGINPSVPKSPQ